MGLFGNFFKSGPSGKDREKATPFWQMPEFQRNYFQEAIQRGGELGLGSSDIFQPVNYSPEQLQAINALQSGVQAPTIGNFNFGKRASSEFDRAGDILSNFQPTLSTALSNIGAGSRAITGEELQSGIGDFINPYTQSVIDPTVRDMRDETARQRSMMEGRASGNLGAFGGARAGLESAELSRGLNREIGRVSGQLRSDAFNTASEQSLRRLMADRANAMTGGQSGLSALDRITGGASTAGGLGSELFNARIGMADLRDQARAREVGRLNEMINAGDILRQFQLEQQQVPITQIDYLRNIATTNPNVAAGQLPNRKAMSETVGGFLKNLTDSAKNVSEMG